MAQRLEGKVAVITGSGRGIGRGVALAMAAEGARVVINDFFKEADGSSVADQVVREIKDAGGTAVANYDSVTTMAGAENIVETAVRNFGRIDILVCCAGNSNQKSLLDVSEEEWDSLISVHLRGHLPVVGPPLGAWSSRRAGRS